MMSPIGYNAIPADIKMKHLGKAKEKSHFPMKTLKSSAVEDYGIKIIAPGVDLPLARTHLQVVTYVLAVDTGT